MKKKKYNGVMFKWIDYFIVAKILFFHFICKPIYWHILTIPYIPSLYELGLLPIYCRPRPHKFTYLPLHSTPPGKKPVEDILYKHLEEKHELSNTIKELEDEIKRIDNVESMANKWKDHSHEAVYNKISREYPVFFDEDSGNLNNKAEGLKQLKIYITEEKNALSKKNSEIEKKISDIRTNNFVINIIFPATFRFISPIFSLIIFTLPFISLTISLAFFFDLEYYVDILKSMVNFDVYETFDPMLIFVFNIAYLVFSGVWSVINSGRKFSKFIAFIIYLWEKAKKRYKKG